MAGDVQVRLASWGAWERRQNLGLGYASSGLALMRASSGDDRQVPAISDDEALRVGRAVLTLRRYSEEEFACIWLSYVNECSAREIKEGLGLAVNTVAARLRSAERWIFNYLESC